MERAPSSLVPVPGRGRDPKADGNRVLTSAPVVVPAGLLDEAVALVVVVVVFVAWHERENSKQDGLGICIRGPETAS